jgi:pSer/pThr/pTyr-binding forkhead associated (FHA) protein
MAPQSYRLVMRTGPHPGKIYDLSQGELSIGRDITNDVVINDAEISRKHARLVAQSGSYVLEDTGSTNGTFVNGQRLMGPHLLHIGELVLLGENVSLVYEAVPYDPDATVATAAALPGMPSTAPISAAPAPVEVYTPPPPPPQPAAPVQSPAPAFPPAYPPQARPQAAPQPSPVRSYSGGMPAGPANVYPAEPGAYDEPMEEVRPSRRTWMFAGLGCLLVLVCACVVGTVVFDQLNLYCATPFTRQVTGIFSTLVNLITGGNYGCP